MYAGVVNRENIRMIQCGQRFGFLLEASQPIRIACEILRQYLDRDIAIEPRVSRAKHLAHPACTDAGGDSVLVERGADHFLSRNSSNQFSSTSALGLVNAASVDS